MPPRAGPDTSKICTRAANQVGVPDESRLFGTHFWDGPSNPPIATRAFSCHNLYVLLYAIQPGWSRIAQPHFRSKTKGRKLVAHSLFRTKSIEQLLTNSENTTDGGLKRTLGSFALVALGIGAIIGSGLFVRTAAAIAHRAGPSGRS